MKKIGTFQSKQWGTVLVYRATYGAEDGPTAIVLDLESGEPLAKLSHNMYMPQCSRDSRALPADCFYVKDHDQEELAAEAMASGLFQLRDDLPRAASGFITAPVWQIKP